MSKEEREDKGPSKKSIYIFLGIILVALTLFVLTFTDEGVNLMLGWIWDYDIEIQLLNANKLALEKPEDVVIIEDGNGIPVPLGRPDVIKMRFTYDNNEMTETRINRSVEIFHTMFPDPENVHLIEYGEETSFVEFTWKPLEPKPKGILVPKI